jgi:hypothetical protein
LFLKAFVFLLLPGGRISGPINPDQVLFLLNVIFARTGEQGMSTPQPRKRAGTGEAYPIHHLKSAIVRTCHVSST